MVRPRMLILSVLSTPAASTEVLLYCVAAAISNDRHVAHVRHSHKKGAQPHERRTVAEADTHPGGNELRCAPDHLQEEV